jgi:hypothetical protein
MAERHLFQGIERREPDLFVDVVYRTNHAYEGALKEAYMVLAGKDASKTTPNNVEKYLLDNKILHERVLELLTNYRQQWRNPSTHDYRLTLSEQEAFTAILSVTAFAVTLLDQVIQHLAAKSEEQRLVEPGALQFLPRLGGLDAMEKIEKLVLALWKDIAAEGSPGSRVSEVEVVGRLQGILAAGAPDLKVVVEPLLGGRLRPDLLVLDGDRQIPIEVKMQSPHLSRREEIGLAQAAHYAEALHSSVAVFVAIEMGSTKGEVKWHENTSPSGAVTRILWLRPERPEK